jgi:hypothetical protein
MMVRSDMHMKVSSFIRTSAHLHIRTFGIYV